MDSNSKQPPSPTLPGSSFASSVTDNSSKDSVFNSELYDDNDTSRNDVNGDGVEFKPASDKQAPVGKEGEGVGEGGGSDVVNGVETNREEYEDKERIERVNSGDEVSEFKVKEGVDVVAVESENSALVDTGEVKLLYEGGSVVGTKVDEVKPGGGGVSESDVIKESDGKVVAEAAVMKPDGVGEDGSGDFPNKGDSVVDRIQVDVLGPGVAVVGEREENGDGNHDDAVKEAVNNQSSEIAVESEGDALENHQPEIHASGDGKDGSGDSPKGDSVVDSIQVDVLGPGVAIVGERGENGGEEAVNGQRSELAVESEEDVLEKHQPEIHAGGDGKDEELDSEIVVDGVNIAMENNGSTDRSGTLNADAIVKEPEVDEETTMGPPVKGDGALEDVAAAEPITAQDNQEITTLDDEEDVSEGDTDGMIFGSSEAAKKFIEELEQGSSEDSHAIGESSFEQPRGIDGQIATDSEEGDTDDEGDGKELFDSAALAALLKAATGSDSDSGNITITSRDGTRLFSVERPAGLGSSLRALRPVPQSNRPNLFGPPTLSGTGESEENLSEEEKKKLEKLQKIRVKFLRLVHRLGLSPEESVAAQVLYRLSLLGGRQGSQIYSLDAAKRMALQLESEERDNLDFSINILVLGKSGVGKSATINSIFGEEKGPIDAFNTGTGTAREISGFIDGVKVRVVDTPGLKTSAMEQSYNRAVLSSVKKLTNRSPTDVFLYVDRLDAQARDLNDMPLLKSITGALGTSIWRSAVVTLTHAASAPPDGPNGNPLSYEVFVTQRSHVVQQSIGQAVGDLRMMSPSLMNPVSLVENHPSCRKNREGQKILPNGQSWRPQLLLLCYSMKILSEANSISKPQDPFDHRKLFGFRVRAPPLPYMLSSMLQSRQHPKLPSDQGGENADSDIDLDEFSDSDNEGEDEYDQLPPFKPLRKSQLAKLSKEQKKAYFEEYDYRVKLLQKKQWKEELRRIKELKTRGKDVVTEEEDMDSGAAAPVAVPLPDMALPPSFDGDNPGHRYRFLEPTSQFLARPVLDNHGWDHDCGYDGVNLEHSLAIANRFPVAYTVQITKDKKDFSISLDSAVSVKHGNDLSSMAGFDIQSMGKQLAYILRGEMKTKQLKKHKAAGGVSLTFLGENVVPGVKVEDQITLGKQYVLVGSAGSVRSQHDTAYGANFELQRREVDYPVGPVQSTLSMSIIKWRGDLALGFNGLTQFSIGRNSKVAVRAGINNKNSGQVTVRTSSSEHLSLAIAALLPTAISIYRKFLSGDSAAADKYSIY